MHKIISFGKIAYFTNRRYNEVTVELELRQLDKGLEFSCCGNVWNRRHTDIICGGQCLDELREYLHGNKLFMEIYDLWKKYHLNGMHAGTEKQENCLEEYCNKNNCPIPQYEERCKILENNNLLYDNGYKYGSAWLFREIPEKDLNRIKEIIA